MDYFTELLNEIEQKIKECEANIEDNNKSMLNLNEKKFMTLGEYESLQEKLNDLETREEELHHPWRTLGKKIFKYFPRICMIAILYIFFCNFALFCDLTLDAFAIKEMVLFGVAAFAFNLPIIKGIKKSCDILFYRNTKLNEVAQSKKTTENEIKHIKNKQNDLNFEFKGLMIENDTLQGNIKDLYEKKTELLSIENEAVSRLMNHPVIQKFQKQLEEYHSKMNELTSLKENYKEQFLNQEYENQNIGQKFKIHLDLQQK